MATLLEIAGLYEGENKLFKRTMGAAMKVAWAILAEDAGTANHANRLVWAQAVCSDRAECVSRTHGIFGRVLSNATVQGDAEDVADNDLEWVVSFFVNDVATGA
jgi:hypothetical protein